MHYACPEGKCSEYGIEEIISEADDEDNNGNYTAGEILDVVLRRQKQSNTGQNIKQTAALNRRAFREATKHAWHSTKIDNDTPNCQGTFRKRLWEAHRLLQFPDWSGHSRERIE